MSLVPPEQVLVALSTASKSTGRWVKPLKSSVEIGSSTGVGVGVVEGGGVGVGTDVGVGVAVSVGVGRDAGVGDGADFGVSVKVGVCSSVEAGEGVGIGSGWAHAASNTAPKAKGTSQRNRFPMVSIVALAL